MALFAPTSILFGQTSRDYKVYDAVIRYMFRDGITRFDMNTKVDQIVIRDRTRSDYSWKPDRETWDEVKMRMPFLSDDTIAGYETARKKEVGLRSKFNIPFKYSLISDDQIRKIFVGPGKSDPNLDQWTQFYETYPRSAGYNSFSRVGFDKKARNALVFFVNSCGSLCATGTYVHVELRDNGWTVKEAAQMWIS